MVICVNFTMILIIKILDYLHLNYISKIKIFLYDHYIVNDNFFLINHMSATLFRFHIMVVE